MNESPTLPGPKSRPDASHLIRQDHEHQPNQSRELSGLVEIASPVPALEDTGSMSPIGRSGVHSRAVDGGFGRWPVPTPIGATRRPAGFPKGNLQACITPKPPGTRSLDPAFGRHPIWRGEAPDTRAERPRDGPRARDQSGPLNGHDRSAGRAPPPAGAHPMVDAAHTGTLGHAG